MQAGASQVQGFEGVLGTTRNHDAAGGGGPPTESSMISDGDYCLFFFFISTQFLSIRFPMSSDPSQLWSAMVLSGFVCGFDFRPTF